MVTESQASTTTKTQPNSPSDLHNTIQKETKSFQTFITKFNNDWSINLAAALAYSLLTTIFPIAIAIVSILGLFFLDATTRKNFLVQVIHVFPAAIQSKDLLDTIIKQLASISGILGIIAFLIALFSGSRLFILIENCFSLIYHVHPRTLIRQNVMAIGMLLLFAFLTPIMFLAASGPALAFSFLQQTPLNRIPGSSLIFSLSGIFGSLLVSFILFEAIYVIVPNQHISFRHSWRGTVVAAIAMQIYLILFPLYVARFSGNYVGQVGFAIILLAFFYYFALILLIGAQVNAFFSEGVRPLTNDLITFTSTMASKLNRDNPQLKSKAHQDTKATDLADRTNIANARQQEKQIRKANRQKQRTSKEALSNVLPN